MRERGIRITTFENVGAGHVAGYLVGSARKVDLILGGAGPPVGPATDRAAAGPIHFGESDGIVLLTDGVMEAENAESRISRDVVSGTVPENSSKGWRQPCRGIAAKSGSATTSRYGSES